MPTCVCVCVGGGNGAGPSDPALTEEQQALLTAGELAAFLNGLRGLCVVQVGAAAAAHLTLAHTHNAWPEGETHASAQHVPLVWLNSQKRRACTTTEYELRVWLRS
jgi:hypothetical protein